MTATATRTVTCEGCGAALTGGVDTYGPHGAALCYLCHFDAKPTRTQAEERREFLAERLKELRRDMKEAKYERDDLEEKIGDCTVRIAEIERELRGGKACEEVDENAD